MRVTINRGDHTYSLEYGGGRLADVFIDGKLVSCTEVGDYDWATSRQRVGLDHLALHAELETWITENGPDHIRELPYL
jgi:uncharacterized protein (DUF1919 family)